MGSELILLVEDEALVALAQRAALTRRGYKVEHARSGESAIELIESGFRPHAVLMDIDLGPGANGIDTARRIAQTWGIPVVFSSSAHPAEIVDRAADFRHHGFVSKLSPESVLFATLRAAIGSST